MAELSAQIVGEVVETCKAAAGEAAAAFHEALDVEAGLSVGEPGTVDMGALPGGMNGGGLAIVFSVADAAALVLLPEASGVLPSWYADPDAAGRKKLHRLAERLGAALLPADHAPERSAAVSVTNLADALVRGGVSDAAAMVPLELRQDDSKTAVAYLVWPAQSPDELVPDEPAAAGPVSPDDSDTQPAAQDHQPVARRPSRSTRDLPPYTRSLLRIKVPVVVTLARKQERLGRILELGPGAIIQFDRSCDEMLELDAGGRPVAIGEAVKVGDKFGLRINSIVLPEERFRPVEAGVPGRSAGTAAVPGR